ncbi:MAG: substrate-binding domain-containing protein [Treponema sp.]|nr:substrate-binding domain-containing protein [Treponema sp.]
MEKPRDKKRLGFILSTIHAGSALKLWHKLVARASENEGAFFVFPGGKLDENPSSDHFRNSIYKLVNTSNIDGLISWASSISGSVTVEKLEEFHKQFNSLPFVTIGQKFHGHPCVEFDAYTGMKELVLHFIQVHGAKKIAFLRGPATHTSAEDRFRGYKDALSESGIDFNNNLVTEPLSWYEGESAIIQLCEERGLVPGKDFEAIVTASDLISFSAVNYLKQKGIRIPKDVMVGGFNDTDESRISIPSFSTVHMPHAELGIEAYDKVSSMLSGMLGVSDSKLPAYAVIRESCGCSFSKIWNSPDLRTKIRTREQFVNEVYRIFRLNREKINLDLMFTALFENDKPKFYDLFNQYISKFFKNDGDLLKVFSTVSVLRCVTFLSPEYIEKIIRHVMVLIPRIQERVLIEKQYAYEKTNGILSSLQNELLSVFDRNELITTLKEHLCKIGIHTVAIVLYEDETYSNYIGGYNVADEVRNESVRFPREFLIPERYSADFDRGAYIVQPLFVEDHAYGYIICNYAECQGVVYEDLRSSVSSVLQGIFLFEQTNEAKHVAEQAEFAKTEFFANVGSDLCDPLKNISDKIQQVETNVENGLLDKDIITEQLLFIRSQIDAQLQKTETLVDLTRSQVDDLPMNKKLFDIRQVLPGGVAATLTKELPLLFGDSERLKRALQTIFEFSEKIPYVSEKPDGIHIEFYSNHFDWQKPELLLAEKIILLQYGEIEKSNNYTEVTLPWPNLASLPPDSPSQEERQIFSLSEKYPKESMGLKIKNFFTDGLDANIQNIILFWEPDSAPIDEWVKVYGLRHNEVLFRAPIICYSHNMVGHDFMDLLEQKIKTQRSSPVLFIGAKHTKYGSWATESNTVSIPSIEEFDDILKEITPSIVVFESINEVYIKKIRQNPKTVLVPILVLPDSILSDEDIELLCSHPRIILCNRGAAESEQFNERVLSILAGEEILPPHTGALVKKAILYLNKNASQQIVRWKLADTVHVSEDYLTRIFHKEIGLSLWEYLNRYRIYIATKMLLETNDTIYEIAEKSGFQDQAYFCRVFKKIYGIPPGKIRSK